MSIVVAPVRGLPPLSKGLPRQGHLGAPSKRPFGREIRRSGGLARSQTGDHAVFDLSSARHSTIYDVRDAVEACSCCGSADARRSCFVVFGLDWDKVDKYLWAVELLQRCFELKGRAEHPKQHMVQRRS